MDTFVRQVADDHGDAAVVGKALAAVLADLRSVEMRPPGDSATHIGRFDVLGLALLPTPARVDRFARQLLAYAGRQSLCPDALELSPFIANLVNALRNALDAGIDLSMDIGDDCPQCYADAGALEEALLTLVINARDAMPSGGHLRFTATAETANDGRRGVALSIYDSGHGMPDDLMRRAKLPFVTSRTHDPLAGMGLAATDGFARQSGGRLTLRAWNGGVCATLHLPQFSRAGTAPDLPTAQREEESIASSKALALSEARLRGILESATDAIITADETQTVLMANRAASEMFGCPIDALIGAPLAQFIPERFREAHERDVKAFGAQAVNARRMGRLVDAVGLRSDGQEFPVEGAISHLIIGGQKFFTVILRDISERRHAELELRESEARFRLLLMQLPDAVIVSTASRITFVNEAAQRLLGDDVNLLGRETLDVFHVDSIDQVKRRFRALSAGASSVPLANEKLVRADGAIRTVQTTSTPIDYRGETSILNVMRDVSELVQVRSDLGQAEGREEQLNRWAFIDSLTALPNRRKFDEHVKDALVRSNRSHWPVILLLVDLDRFKEVNDSLGHAAGDAVLVEFARRLERSVRATDFVARLGGDEFVIVLDGAQGLEGAELVAKNIRSTMQTPFSLGEGAHTHITTSIGISVSAIDQADPSALLAWADEALYRVKHAGRDAFAVSNWHDPGRS